MAGTRKVTGGHFVVEFTNKAAAAYSRNQSISVLCETAERALEIVREHYPEAVIHVVRRLSSSTVLLLDKLTTYKEPKKAAPRRLRAVTVREGNR